jgi:hypothetical protein
VIRHGRTLAASPALDVGKMTNHQDHDVPAALIDARTAERD